jgi:hypothetical protein
MKAQVICLDSSKEIAKKVISGLLIIGVDVRGPTWRHSFSENS